MNIRIDDLRGPEIAELLREHLRNMHRLSPPEQPAFAPARGLYARFGFMLCGPFGDYIEDPNSVFMTREL